VSTPDTIDELLLRWQELRRHGVSASVQELCAEHPSLVDELTRRIAAFESMEALLGIGQSSTLPDLNAKPGVPDHLAAKLLPLGYELLSVIDHGGMGVVYRANQVKLGRVVALKMIAGLRASPKHLARFRVEVEAVARLHHPHIVQIYEVGEVDGHSFFAMEYVPNGTLSQLLTDGPLPPVVAAELMEIIARAVYHAHTRGIIHRDLKPGNILLQKEDEGSSSGKGDKSSGSAACFSLPHASFQPKVADFGVAKQLGAETDHTTTGEIIGTPGYMAPEQAQGKTELIGPACDVYALGAILYEALTGRPPFQAKTVLETLQQVISDDPTSPRRVRSAIPRDLEAICLKCLEKNPGYRYATAEAFADDLHRFASKLPVVARPLSLTSRSLKWARRRPLWAGLFLLVLLAPLVVLAWHYIERARHERHVIERAVEVAPQTREILQRHCYECHGKNPAKAERKFLVLDRSSLLDPNRKNVIPRDADHSRLIQRIEDETMPPEDEELRLPRVSAQELAVLKEWIAGGAPPFPPEDPQAPTPAVVPYSQLAADVKAIFVENCYDCHHHRRQKKEKEEEEPPKGGIKILNHNLLISTRKVVIPGNPAESELYRLIVADESNPLMMPPKNRDRLPPEDIEKIRKWIEAGAPPFPRTEDGK
jgi:serine/threonine protein kinase